MATKELICIICPRGCHLSVDENMNVTGNSCPRGAAYAKQELTNPTRTITSTVRCDSKLLEVCPVKTKDPIPKGKIFDVMAAINAAKVTIPVHIGDVVIKNVAETGTDLVSTREILE